MRKRILGLLLLSGALLAGSATVSARDNMLRKIAAPSDMTEYEDGFLVTDTYNRVIWKVTEEETVLYAGDFATEDIYGQPVGGYFDTINKNSFFKKPWSIEPFLDGFAVSDPDNKVIRFVDGKNTKTVNGKDVLSGAADMVTWERPMGLSSDEQGNLYVADAGAGTISKIDTTGKVTEMTKGLDEPTGICWKDGALYIAETGCNRILKLENGETEVIAGTGIGGMKDGDITEAQVASPQGVEVTDDGTFFIADTGNNAVRMVKDGQMSTLIAADQAELQQYPVEPLGMYCEDGKLYVCDPFARCLYTLEY